ncbi:metal-dependent hydrolase [Tsukamurella sp. 8F]|uniref:metal-dependent hydrolase n=1 Tax=unclassified Tsukamurella TaxID=2633480 RepID=UPI0023B91B64|nr:MULTISPECIES: metal-dependent hydrolase [unclassified Tsukamurella]MDF0531651.1 metal-dependent hydrolase [Tsukamurella sp. 8J]MDF0588781.1 metal-dependent hydrolase [Tsukamurella sp. 8F]
MTADEQAQRQALEPLGVELHARNVTFDWSRTPLHWIAGEPVASDICCILHLVLPEGERWFCEVFNEALPFVKDEELATAMRGFIGQEAMHAESHDKAVGEFLEARGIDTGPALRQVEYIFRKILAPRSQKSDRARYNDMVQRLWLVAAIEHYTAILGDFVLNCAWDEYDVDPTMADICRWHGAEEVEHRSVAHDVAMYFDPSYLHRCRAMVIVVVALLAVLHRAARFVCHEDPNLSMSYPRLWFEYLRGSHRNILPKVRSVVRYTLLYFDPRFDPATVGSTAQAVAYLATSPAARRAAA